MSTSENIKKKKKGFIYLISMMYTPVLYTFAIISFVHLIFTESLPCTRQWSRPLILLELVTHGEGWGRRVAVVRTWWGRQTNPTRKNIHVMQSLLTGYKPQTLRCLSECRCRVCWERRKNTWPGWLSPCPACPPARPRRALRPTAVLAGPASPP